MKNSLLLIFLAAICLSYSCTEKHLISDKNYLDIVEKSFIERQSLFNKRKALLSVFTKDLSIQQVEALKFLYSFMPLNDLADYSGDFFLGNVNISLRARYETQWGKSIPEEVFLHYVLPPRVNNENLDSFRIAYYDEIIERVKGKSIIDAALEVNHWCHEKVSYQPADIRTSAPMSTILSARGRCGEESTFTVAALRTAGIPARQVYTPRWAHSDDNHAWVEIWVEGKWYYMGACEPEPSLDLGWFTEPARRAMLIHTKSFGAISGDENTIIDFRNYAEVNNLSKYAVTKKIIVRVLDKNGKPVSNARVEYQLYNYSEFYPLAIVPTTVSGISSFETGLGDLLIWASRDDDFDFRKISVSENDTLVLTLNRKPDPANSIDLDLGVPVILPPLVRPDSKMAELNAKRVSEENIIREEYTNSWIKSTEVRYLALNLNLDAGRLLNIFTRSMGNYKEIRTFIKGTPDSLKFIATSLLEVLPDKDLRDTKSYILTDHLLSGSRYRKNFGEKETGLFIDYVLNPRIANEMLASWRGFFLNNLPADLLENAVKNPSLIIDYTNKNVAIDNDENYYKTPVTPQGVYELKVSDSFSRSIFFIAVCRSVGIPARLEPGSNVPQYFSQAGWIDVYFEDQKRPSIKRGYIKLASAESNPVPEYYIHFTLARFENGKYNTLEYDYNRKISDFKEDLSLIPGDYMLVTGNRLNDSKILSSMSFFNLAEGEHKTIEVKLRKETFNAKSIGQVDLNEIISIYTKDKAAIEKITKNGVVVIWIEPDKEPTKHIFNDLPILKTELDRWGGYFLFLADSQASVKGFKSSDLKGLPQNSLFAIDDGLLSFKKSVGSSLFPDIRFPLVILADKKGNILFTSTGYRIGIGEQILTTINNCTNM